MRQFRLLMIIAFIFCATLTGEAARVQIADVPGTIDTLTVTGTTINEPSTAQVIDAAGDAILANATTTVLNPDADYVLTSTPTIADGTTGQIVYITCASGETKRVTLQDQDTLASSNLQLLSPMRTIYANSTLKLEFNGTDWQEVSYVLDGSIAEYNIMDFGATGDGTTDDTAAIQAAIDAAATANTVAIFPAGTYIISNVLTLTGNTEIVGGANVTIQMLSGTIKDSLINDGDHKLVARNIEFDGNDDVTVGIFSTGSMPELYDCVIHGAYNAIMTGGTLAGNGTDSSGKFIAARTTVYDCDFGGFMLYGDQYPGSNPTTEVLLDNCEGYEIGTEGVSGIPYWADHMKNVQVLGGEWTGVTEANPNCYRCENVQILGGYYHGMSIGPVFGKDTVNGIVTGVLTKNMGSYGISVDTALDGISPPSYDRVPPGYIVVSGNVDIGSGSALRIQGDNCYIDGNISIDSVGSAFLFQDSQHVVIGDNQAYNPGVLVASFGIDYSPNTTYKMTGKFAHDSDSTTPLLTSSEQSVLVEQANIQHIWENSAYVNNDADLILVDATDNVVIINLPKQLYFQSTGHTFRVVKVDDSANQVLVSVTSEANVTIDGGTTSVKLYEQNEMVEITTATTIIGGVDDSGTDNDATMTDTTRNFRDEGFIASANTLIENVTDGSSGVVTSITSSGADTYDILNMTGGLAGGTDNDWDDGDEYVLRRFQYVTSKPPMPFRLSEATGAGLKLVRNDDSTETDDLLGAIGFDSVDGGVSANVTHASASIEGYASELHSVSDKGGYLVMRVSPINQDPNLLGNEQLRIIDGGARFSGNLVSNTYNFAADAQADDDYEIALSPAPAAYTTGMVIIFTAKTENTGACTVNVNGLGVISLKSLHNQDPQDSYIEAGSVVVGIYDGSVFQLISPDANP